MLLWDLYYIITTAELTTIQNKTNKQDIIEVSKQEKQKYKMAIRVDRQDNNCCGTA